MQESYDIEIENLWVKIYINGYLHLLFKQDKLLGLQSYKKETNLYCIELTFATNIITTEYDSPERWSQILKLLDENI